MSRSLKKGPFVDDHLLKKIDAQNAAGERKGGPAPRGLDRFAAEVSNGSLTVNTGLILQGPPIGTNTTGQEAEGPHCVTGGE